MESVKKGFIGLNEAIEKFSYFLKLKIDTINLSDE